MNTFILEVGDKLVDISNKLGDTYEILSIDIPRAGGGKRSLLLNKKDRPYPIYEYMIVRNITRGLLKLIKATPQVNLNTCNHTFITYKGFTNTFDYCSKCDEKK